MSEELIQYITGNPMQLAVVVKGEVVSSNLPEFRAAIKAFVGNINQTLESDEQFGQAEIDVKSMKELEKMIQEGKKAAIEQAAELNNLLLSLDAAQKEVSTPRLALEKLIDAQKIAVRAKLVADALAQIDVHPLARAAQKSFLEAAIKGKKNLSSMVASLEEQVAYINGKIAKNKEILQGFKNANGTHLIPDEQALLTDSTDALSTLLENRLLKFQKEETERKAEKALAEERAASAERERIARAEAEKSMAAANAVAAATPANPLPLPAPPRAAEEETEEEERARIVAAILSALGGIKPMLDAVKHAHNVAHVKAFRAAVNPAFQLLKKGGNL